MAVGRAEIHAAQGVKLCCGSFEGRADFHFQLICKLEQEKRGLDHCYEHISSENNMYLRS